MNPEAARREELLAEIEQKLRFLGTEEHFESLCQGKSVAELESTLTWIDHGVRVHSDPMLRKVFASIDQGTLDPRWEPFVNFLKANAQHRRRLAGRLASLSIVRHVATSTLLLNYICTLWDVTLFKPEGTGFCTPEYANSVIKAYFARAQATRLLHRSPMVFSEAEDFKMKVLLQTARGKVAKLQGPIELSDTRAIDEDLKEVGLSPEDGLPMPAPETEYFRIEIPSILARRFFGGRRGFDKTSIYEYGDRTFREIFEYLISASRGTH